MDEATFNQLQQSGQVDQVSTPQPTETQSASDDGLDDYVDALEGIRRLKGYRTSVPTAAPKSFLGQIQFIDDGAKKIAFWFNKAWTVLGNLFDPYSTTDYTTPIIFNTNLMKTATTGSGTAAN